MKRVLIALAATWIGAAPAASSENGATLSPHANYLLYCSGCHRQDGAGAIEGGIPAFQDSVGYIAGIETGRTYIMHVPGVISTNMSDADVAGVLNYILDRWGEEGGADFSAEEVTRRRALPVADVVVYRRQVVKELKEAGIEIADYPWP
ncbi:cytochrome c [Sedimentitalea sp. XS_ASV28]|uniref:c-type cytochrome n=1 Tax=Sedimentitalea sp. XS_ASV28 TaxID=3241296 RepID=UPI003516C650